MAKKQCLDAATLAGILQSAGDFAPALGSFLQQLAEVLKQRQQTKQGVKKCPNADMAGCCDRALAAACTTVAELLACQDCCCPEDGDSGA